MPILDTLPAEVIDAIGIAGFGLYVLNYALLTFRRVESTGLTYFSLNWIAAALVLIGLSNSFNLASAMIQIFWIGISTVAIVLRLRTPKPQPANVVSMTDRAAI